MASKRRGLNKGLDILLADTFSNDKQEEAVGLKEILITELQPGRFQPRKEMREEELASLANSIKEQGILQPIVVCKRGDKFEIIAGERRWRAAGLASLEKVPVIVKEVPDQAAMAIALIENIQRQDLNPLEEARALEKFAHDFQMTHADVAKAVGKSRTAVTNLLRLLNLHSEVKQYLERDEINLGHAKVLLAVEGERQQQIARIIVDKGLSVRETEQLVNVNADQQEKTKAQGKNKKPIDPDVRRLQISLSEKIGSPVMIDHHLNGGGKVVIKYSSVDEFEGILEHII